LGAFSPDGRRILLLDDNDNRPRRPWSPATPPGLLTAGAARGRRSWSPATAPPSRLRRHRGLQIAERLVARVLGRPGLFGMIQRAQRPAGDSPASAATSAGWSATSAPADASRVDRPGAARRRPPRGWASCASSVAHLRQPTSSLAALSLASSAALDLGRQGPISCTAFGIDEGSLVLTWPASRDRASSVISTCHSPLICCE